MALTKITTSVVAVNSLTAANIADNSIDATKIANNQILARHIAAGALSDQIAANSITAAMIPNATALTLDGGVTIDNITIDGTTLALSSGSMTIDVVGSISLDADDSGHVRFKDGGSQYASIYKSSSNFVIDGGTDLTLDITGTIILDADAGVVDFKDGGTHIGRFENASSDFKLESRVQDKDIVLVGNDSGTGVEALRLDMSEAGKAIFNAGATFASGVTVSANGLTVSGGGIVATGNLSVDGNIEMTTGAGRRLYMGGTSGNTFGMAYNSGNPNYGIFYTEGSPDVVNLSPNGSATAGVLQALGDGRVRTTGDLLVGLSSTINTDYAKSLQVGGYTSGNAIGHLGVQGFRAAGDYDYGVISLYHGTNENVRLIAGRDGADNSAYFKLQTTNSGTASTAMQIGRDGFMQLYAARNEYGLSLKSEGTRSGLVVKTPGTNTITGSLLLVASDTTLRLGTQSYYNIHMNQSGHNTMPNQPYIRCAGSSSGMVTNQGTNSDYSSWSNQVQTGITRSGATFTVPTAGNYLITYSFYNWINNSGPGVTHAVYLKKGSTTIQETVAEYDFENDSYSYYDNQLQNSIVLNMAAGDTFKFVAYADIYGGGTHTNMSAYLLG